MELNIAVVGMGYVGAVSAAMLAEAGHRVHGVESDPAKLELYKKGQSPITEPGLGELIGCVHSQKRLVVSADLTRAVMAADVVLICVGTPSKEDGAVNLAAIEHSYQQIAEVLKAKLERTLLLTRSTVPCGTHEQLIRPLLMSHLGELLDERVQVLSHPEFLREGAALQDWRDPPFVVFGGALGYAGSTIARMYSHLEAPVRVVGYREAELLKYACNAFHALKIDFANEIGAICSSSRVDSRAVMQLLCSDDKLNISRAYLRPGFAFGGSCLPKDVRALCRFAQRDNTQVPVLQALLPSNEAHFERAWHGIEHLNSRHIGMIGLTFKSNTDDLRESPAVLLAERMIGRGLQVKIFDPELEYEGIIGANRRFVNRHLEHLAGLLVSDLSEVINGSELLVITHPVSGLERLGQLVHPDQQVFDLSGAFGAAFAGHRHYYAFAGLGRSPGDLDAATEQSIVSTRE